MLAIDKNIAVIDIGSNSVRLKVFADGKTLLKQRAVTRLGEGLFKTQCLNRDNMEMSAVVIEQFCERAKEFNATVYPFATAAVRTALNREIFLNMIKSRVGLDVDVISGELEAEIGLLGAIGDTDEGAIIDIGGNSTEISARKNGKIFYSQSVEIGAVKLKDICGENEQLLKKTILQYVDQFKAVQLDKVSIIGGTATCIGSIVVGGNADGFDLSVNEIERQLEVLRTLSVEDRKALKGMDKSKADVIVGGCMLLNQIYRKFSISQAKVCETDNLEGYVIYLKNGIKGQVNE